MPHGHLVVRSANRLEEFFAAELLRLDPLAVQADGFPVRMIDVISLSVGSTAGADGITVDGGPTF